MKTPSIRIEEVTHRYGDILAIKNATFEVASGEVVCLLGPSGCGKTTILRVSSGIERLQEGRIIIDDVIVADGSNSQVSAEKRGIGMVFQDSALFPHLTVEGNISFGLKGYSKNVRREIVSELLKGVGLDSFAKKYPHTLSGGEQQRVALLRALAPNPSVMFMDEPFSSLDIKLRTQVRDDAIKILKDRGVATIFVTHDFEEAMLTADRIILMKEGKIIQIGRPEELYNKPKNQFVASFFGDINVTHAIVDKNEAKTIFGTIKVPFPHGSRICLMVRPEDLFVEELDDSDENYEIFVKEKRELGAYTLLQLIKKSSSDVIFARVLRKNSPKLGSKVIIQLDQPRAFVFPVN
tara:strand:- start:1252 stop:2304 length:1053 start_codon:yes stop_codon:yes gene_type:complete